MQDVSEMDASYIVPITIGVLIGMVICACFARTCCGGGGGGRKVGDAEQGPFGGTDRGENTFNTE